MFWIPVVFFGLPLLLETHIQSLSNIQESPHLALPFLFSGFCVEAAATNNFFLAPKPAKKNNSHCANT